MAKVQYVSMGRCGGGVAVCLFFLLHIKVKWHRALGGYNDAVDYDELQKISKIIFI